MSDPVTQFEIEDVLSSIRRLVSDDKKPDGDNSAPSQSPAKSDRLVLTPALRVAEPEDDENGFVAARALNPQKARLLLQMLLANGVTDPAAIQSAFDNS